MRFEYEISKYLSLAIYLVNFLLMLSIELNTGPDVMSTAYFKTVSWYDVVFSLYMYIDYFKIKYDVLKSNVTYPEV